MFLIDYAHRRRIKIWGTAKVVEGDAALIGQLMPEDYKARPEQVVLFTVTAWDANCPQHIPQRFEAADVAAALGRVTSGSRRSKPRSPVEGRYARETALIVWTLEQIHHPPSQNLPFEKVPPSSTCLRCGPGYEHADWPGVLHSGIFIILLGSNCHQGEGERK